MKIKLGNEIQFNVSGIVDNFGTLEITFAEGTTYEEVSKVYDPISSTYNQESLRRMEVYSEEELQGTHLGYTETHDISCLNGIVKVKIKKEDELKTEVELLKLQNVMLNGALSELSMIVSMGAIN